MSRSPVSFSIALKLFAAFALVLLQFVSSKPNMDARASYDPVVDRQHTTETLASETQGARCFADENTACKITQEPAASTYAPSFALSQLITYTTEDANMQIGILLNDWNMEQAAEDDLNASFTIWWNNPSESIVIQDGSASDAVVDEPAADVIQNIWVYRNAFDLSPEAFSSGEAGIVAHHQPYTTRGAWVFTVPVVAGDWFVIKFQDTFSTTASIDGISRSDLTWVVPIWYDPQLQWFTNLDIRNPEMGQHPQVWNRFAVTDSAAVEYLDPGKYCADGGVEGVLCDLTLIALVVDNSLTQGQQIVLDHRETIAAVAAAYQVPEISLGSGIANQANAFTRPFDTDFLERCLISLPDGPFTGAGASVGVAQITPDEMSSYLPDCNEECLFDRQKSFEMMAAKLNAADALLPADIDPTDRLMILALAQNNGAGPAESYINNGKSWQVLYEQYSQGGYTWDRGDWDQLGKILKIIIHLLEQGYTLPDGVDLNRWQQIYNFQGQQ